MLSSRQKLTSSGEDHKALRRVARALLKAAETGKVDAIREVGESPVMALSLGGLRRRIGSQCCRRTSISPCSSMAWPSANATADRHNRHPLRRRKAHRMTVRYSQLNLIVPSSSIGNIDETDGNGCARCVRFC